MFNPNLLYMPGRSILPIARKTINWAGLLSNTQKTLNIVNQAIPIVYQVKPMINNAKTMFKIADALKDDKNSTIKQEEKIVSQNVSSTSDNKPIFFI